MSLAGSSIPDRRSLADPAPPPRGLPPLETELPALRMRRDSLRQASDLPGTGLRVTLEAALAELDAAIDALAAAQSGQQEPAGRATAEDPAITERQLLRATFTDAPVPLFLLERDGTVRRANRAAGRLTGSGTGYATGRPFTTFLHLPSRAPAATQLAAVIRTGQERAWRCELLTPDGPLECDLLAGPVRLRGDADQLIVAVRPAASPGTAGQDGRRRRPAGRAGRPAGPASRAGAAEKAPPAVVAALTRRLDLATAVTRLLLENVTRSESVTLQQCARLLADELTAWVIVDVLRGHRLRRQFVLGPQDEPQADLARTVAAADPAPGTAPAMVARHGGTWLEAHAEDPSVLGQAPDGVPLLMLLGATSVLSVPITDGEQVYGVLTLARPATSAHFGLADLGLMEELGQQLALAVRANRVIRQHSEIAGALRAKLLPRELPGLPGAEVAAVHLAASDTSALGGDFYDVYRMGSNGCGIVIGDVCGRGEGVAGVSAAARHMIRVIAHYTPGPSEVLGRANEVLLAEGSEGRFVTAIVAHAQWQGSLLRVSLAVAGHPGPVLVRGDGQVVHGAGGGQPLGIFPDAGAGTEEYELSEGDLLFFYTDGLTVSCGPELGSFEDRLAGELAAMAGQHPAEALPRLQASAQAWCGGDIRDDITMLALRAGSPP
jgi:serine phosphatase RsbU (regulator of sigma subunit)/PAS domain-containing protein